MRNTSDTELMPMPEIESRVVECSSVDEAKAKGAEIWGIQPDDIDATVISEDKKLFGLLGSTYKVEIAPFAPVSYIKSCHFVNEMLDKMDLDLIPELTDDGIINLVGEDAGVVIGRYGETLKALEYITNLVCHDDMSTQPRADVELGAPPDTHSAPRRQGDRDALDRRRASAPRPRLPRGRAAPRTRPRRTQAAAPQQQVQLNGRGAYASRAL